MKEIPLTKGFVALVDDEDYETLMQVPWCWDAGYVLTTTSTETFKEAFGDLGITTSRISMHRRVMKAAKGVEIDHWNGVTTDNQKTNLRPTSHANNMKNRVSRVGTSKFKGVCWTLGKCKWQVYITTDGVRQHLGFFFEEVLAALAYDRAASKQHAEFALLNFPEDPQQYLPSAVVTLPSGATGYFGVDKLQDVFCCRVKNGGRWQRLGRFENAYDAALYRDHHIEKNNLTSRMNFS
jgi:hypothetical protein